VSGAGDAPSAADRAILSTDERERLQARLVKAAKRLKGGGLPDMELPSYMAGIASLHGLASDCAAIYLYPGTEASPLDGADSPALDLAQHKAFNDGAARLRDFGCRAIGISTETTTAQSITILRNEVNQELLSDPEARLGKALGLDTFHSAPGLPAYYRMILITESWVIREVLIPDDPTRSAEDVLDFLRARPA
jgi:peroxiredoxin